MRKVRSDARLANLPDDQFAALCDWLAEGLPYRVARERLLKDFQVPTSMAALCGFWNDHAAAYHLERRRRAVGLANEIAGDVDKGGHDRLDEATLAAIKQKAFELSVSPQTNAGEIKALFGLLLKARGQDLDREQITLARERFEFDAAKSALAALDDLRSIASDRSLDETARVDAVRQRLFGVVAGTGV